MAKISGSGGCRGPEIEAISASLRDLTDFAHGVVGKSGNIDIFLRLASSH
jgi:hypothetical protein